MKKNTCLTLTLLLLTLPTALFAAPAADLWERWSKHDPDSTQIIDHTSWDELLQRYVSKHEDGINRFAYSAVTTADKRRLKAYLSVLSNTSISDFSRAQQFAYWVNMYNALTIDLILDNYPLKSIRDLSGSLFSAGPWDNKLITVEGEKLSLNDIEHRILRPVWKDPRIHYAVNCASFGCPNLQPEAYDAVNTDRLLDYSARKFINNRRAVAIGYGKLKVSSIYIWYQADFGNSEAGVIQHLQTYAEPSLKSSLEGIGKVSDYHYDWTLNDSVTPALTTRSRASAGS